MTHEKLKRGKEIVRCVDYGTSMCDRAYVYEAFIFQSMRRLKQINVP